MLKVFFLGQPRFLLNDQPLRFSARPKTFSLLAYLLLYRDQPISRETLAFTLWPDESEKAARANLRRHLNHLTTTLPRAKQFWFISDSDTAQWNPASDYWLDCAEFERLTNHPGTHAQSLALYTDDLLQDLYDDWIIHERERLRNLYFKTISDLITQLRAERDFARAMAYAQILALRDPLREDAARVMMTLAYEMGDRAGALKTFDEFSRRLRDEIAVEPMPETLVLRDQIARNARLPIMDRLNESNGNRALTPKKDFILPAPLLPFVGRADELIQLKTRWERAARGNGNLAMISGEAGIGKTRLTAELARIAEREGARVLYGGTAPDESTPYQAIAEALRAALALVATLDLEPIWLAALARLIPELRQRRPDLPTLAALDPERERARLFEAITLTVVALAAPRPLLLILEDLHWATATTIGLLEYLVRRATNHSILILITAREEESARTHPLREFRRKLENENLFHIGLGRIASPAVSAMLAQMSGLNPELAGALAARSEGNPFFLGELIREVNEGHLEMMEGAPSGVRAIIMDRVSRVGALARSVAEIAAIVGGSFSVELAREVGGWSESETYDATNELLDRQIIREAGGRGAFPYVFSHHLIQETVYAEQDSDARKRRHRRAASVMQELFRDRQDEWAGELAMHFDRGGDAGNAVAYYLRAANHSASLYADDQSLRSLTRGFELTEDVQKQFSILALREIIYARRGERDAQRADLDRMETRARKLGDNDSIGVALLRRIDYHARVGESEAQAKLIRELKTRALASPHASWQADALAAEGEFLFKTGEADAAQRAFERALALRESLGDVRGQVECLKNMADVAAWHRDLDRVAALAAAVRPLAEQSNNPYLLAQALRTLASLAFSTPDFAMLEQTAQQLLDLCRKIGDRQGEANAHARLAHASGHLFQIERAREHYRKAESIYSAIAAKRGLGICLGNWSAIELFVGNSTRGKELAERAVVIFESLHDAPAQITYIENIVIACMYAEDYAQAKSIARRALEITRSNPEQYDRAIILESLGGAERELGELDASIEHLEQAVSIGRASARKNELASYLAEIALTYARAGKMQPAQSLAEESLNLCAALGVNLAEAPRLLWYNAQVLRALGENERARAILAQAFVTLQSKTAAIRDADAKSSYRQIPAHRQLIAAHQDWGLQSAA